MNFSVSTEYNFITIRLIPYFWCTHVNTSSLTFLFSSIQSTIYGNSKVREVVSFTEYKFCTIWHIPYFWCTHIHTSSLTFIVLPFYCTIIGDNKARTIVCLNWMKFFYDLTHYIFFMRSHSYFTTHIHCLFNSTDNLQEQRGKISCLFQLNTMFLRLDSLHIFDALAFILHHSLKLFHNYYFPNFSSQFWIHKDILKQGLETEKKSVLVSVIFYAVN